MITYRDHMLAIARRAYETGDHAGAEAVLRLILGRSGNDAYALYFLGHLAYLRSRPRDALVFLAGALAMDPGQARAHHDLGEALRALGRTEDALPHLERAIALEPTLAHAHGNLANALIMLDRPEDALLRAQESLRLGTSRPDAYCDLGNVYSRLDQVREAIAHYDLALAEDPTSARARYFRALMRLKLGDMPDAWADHEARLGLPALAPGIRQFPRPMWTGAQDVAGKTVLLHAEQSFGDTIQFVRYVPLIEARGATVLLAVQRGLGALCRSVTRHVFEPGSVLPPFDLHCSLLSLPAAFGTGIATVPATMPYLKLDPAIEAQWAARLGPWRKMRIGLAWAARNGPAPDPARSVPFAMLEPLLRRADIEWHLVQREPPAGDLMGAVDHSALLTDFAQTAALLGAMDMVVTVDTAIAHLAGALHMNTWLMLPLAADWRWMQDRDDSLWYPSVRLFRQKRRGQWAPVLEAVSRNLDAWAVPRG